MKRKNILTGILMLVLVLCVAVPSVMAEDFVGHKKRTEHKKGMDSMVLLKMHMIMKNQEELGLSDEQVEKIRALKLDTKKKVIMQKAEIEVLAVDIKAKLWWGDPVDMEAVNKLIDQKYEIKKGKAKNLAGAIAELKKILTEEQKDKLKALRKEHHKGKQ